MRLSITWSIIRNQCSTKPARPIVAKFQWGKYFSTVTKDEENDEHDIINKVQSPSIDSSLEKQIQQLKEQNKQLLQELATIAQEKSREIVINNSHQWSPVYQFREGEVGQTVRYSHNLIGNVRQYITSSYPLVHFLLHPSRTW